MMSDRTGDLLICEDVMLLLLDDHKGTLLGAWSRWMIAGAALMDLDALGRMRPSTPGEFRGRRERLVLQSTDSTDSSILDPVLMRLANRDNWRPEMAINQIQRRLLATVGDELTVRGMVRTETRTVFGLKRWPVIDDRRKSAARSVLGEVLIDGVEPDPHTTAVIAALWAGGQAHRIVLRERRLPARSARAAVRRRAEHIARSHWLARPTQRAIQGQQAAASS